MELESYVRHYTRYRAYGSHFSWHEGFQKKFARHLIDGRPVADGRGQSLHAEDSKGVSSMMDGANEGRRGSLSCICIYIRFSFSLSPTIVAGGCRGSYGVMIPGFLPVDGQRVVDLV